MKTLNLKNHSLYFVNFPVDFTFLCGISFLLYGFAWSTKTFEASMETKQIVSLIAWFINWPHFAATSYRLYSDRNHRNQFPITTYIVPLILIALLGLSLSAPETIGVGFVKFYFLWSAMHFSAQSFGITQLYLSRAGIKIDRISRSLIWCVIYFSFVYTFVASQVGISTQDYFALKIPSFQLPFWMKEVTQFLYATLMVMFILWFALQKKRKIEIPWMVFWITVTQCIWYSVYFISFFNEFVPMLHCLQYLFLAYFIEMKEKGLDSGVSKKQFGLLWLSGKWAAINIFGGALLFYYLPLLGPLLGYKNAGAFTALVWSFVQIHHFFVDGVIWKLRYSTTASPLHTTWREIKGETA